MELQFVFACQFEWWVEARLLLLVMACEREKRGSVGSVYAETKEMK
jgi:hypothetical protein